MRFDEWEPIYQEILKDFGFSRDRDCEAARCLRAQLVERSDLQALEVLIRGQKVLICGNAPSLTGELEELIYKGEVESTVISADGATTKLLKMGIVPEIIVTDLDGFLPDITRSNKLGSIVVVHAHGDNIEALQRWVPELCRIVGTTQTEPFDDIHNFGGFTDGDRCVFLARHFEAAEIRLIGFDFDDDFVTPRKKKKLKWARKLVEMALSKDDLISKETRIL